MRDLIIDTLEDVKDPIEFIDLYHLCNIDKPEDIRTLQEELDNLLKEFT